MSFASDAGYIPIPIDQMMSLVMANVNLQFGTTYTPETFLGTNFYKFYYALMQLVQANEVKASEIFLRMQEYFSLTNERILRPNTTHPGIFDYFQSKGYFVSTKPPADVDAGKAFICIDVNSALPTYATVIKPYLCGIVKDCVVAGAISQGTEVTSITLSNGQSFDFKYNLPTKIPILLRLTTVLSQNNQVSIGTPDATKSKLFANINASYRLGKNFEPQRYFSVLDAPWSSSVLLEYSLNAGVAWLSTTYVAAYDAVLTFGLADITVVET